MFLEDSDMEKSKNQKDNPPNIRDIMYFKFCLYGFLKNQRFFDPFIILFFREMGISFLQIGTLFSIREISTNILEIPTGIIADSYGRKKSMIFAFSSYIISFIIFYFFPKFLIYSIAMVFFASGEAFRSGTHKAMILQYLKVKNLQQHKVYYYGHTRAASQFGSAISSLIAIAIVFFAKSYRPIFLFSIIPYVMGLLLIFTYPSYLDGEIEKSSGRWWNKMKKKTAGTLKEFKKMFLNTEALRSILNSSVFDGFFKASKDYLQPILKSQAVTLPFFLFLSGKQRTSLIVGLIYFILFLLTSTASRKSGQFVKKLKSLPFAINITYISGIILLFLSGLFTNFNLFWGGSIFLILLYIVQNLRRPMNVAYISDKISHKAMASGLSVESQIKTIVVAVISPVIGFFADRNGVGISLIIISLLFLFTLPFVIIKEKKGDKNGR